MNVRPETFALLLCAALLLGWLLGHWIMMPSLRRAIDEMHKARKEYHDACREEERLQGELLKPKKRHLKLV